MGKKKGKEDGGKRRAMVKDLNLEMKQGEEDVELLWCGFIVRHLFDNIAPLFI